MKEDGLFDRLGRLDVNTVRLCAVVLIAVVVGVILAVNALDDDEAQGDRSQAVVLSEPELLARAGGLSHLAYWVGPQPGAKRYELTSKPGEQIYIRYLPSAAQAEDRRPRFLIVGTYAVPDARRALEDAARGPKGSGKLSRQNGFEMMSAADGQHAYVVFADQPELQIEVFSPRPGEAERLALSGALQPLREG